jgi:hypothetical protein
MKMSKALLALTILVALLALVQSSAGLFWQTDGSAFSFTNLRGQTIQMSGQGLYRDNPSFNVPIQRGTDAITLFLFIPLLIVAIILYQGGSLRGQLLLTAMHASFLYNAASLAFGVTYNQLFLVYLAYFSASLFAFLLAVTSIDLRVLASRISPAAPRRGIAILLFVAGLGLLFAWLPDILAGLPQGWNAGLASYTTMVTDVLDLGIILPAVFLAGILLLRRSPLGYLLASILTTMLILIGAVITAQTIAQSLAGIHLGMGEFIGKGGSFMLLSLIGIWLMLRFFRSISEKTFDS